MKQRSLKRVLIIPSFQGQVVLFILAAGLACAALNGYLYYMYVVDSYDFIFRYTALPKDLIDERYGDLLQIGLGLFVLTLLLILMIAVSVLVITHRAAGAVYHMKRVIEEIRAGNIDARVHLRDKDQFKDVADAFNHMMDELRGK